MPPRLDAAWAAVRLTVLVTVSAAVVSGLVVRSSLAGDMLYWTAVNEGSGYALRRSGLDGSDVEDIVMGIEDDLAGLALDAGARKLYWVERGVPEYRIVRADLDGDHREVVHATEEYVYRLALDAPGRAIYFTASRISGGAGIRRLGLTSGEIDEVIAGEVVDLAVDSAGGRIYWVEQGLPEVWGTDIWRAGLDGSGREPIVHHRFEHHTTGIALDPEGGKIYWATVDYLESRGQLVQRANLDGSDVETVTTANPGLDDWPVFLDIELRSRRLYWVNGEDGEFYRVSLDGGEAERLHEDSGPYGPFDMVLLESDEVPPEFRRGDADGDGDIDLTDPISTLGALFLGAGGPPCSDAADVNDDGVLDLTDAVASLSYLFLGSFDIPAPGPLDCGSDPTPSGPLGCEGYPSCSG